MLTLFFKLTAGTLQNLVKEHYLDLNAFVKCLEDYLNRMFNEYFVPNVIDSCCSFILGYFIPFTIIAFRYVIQMLPLLLVSFSDQVVAVREAAECAARAMMSQLSAQGVKLVLPSLLKVINIANFLPLRINMFASYKWISHLSHTHTHTHTHTLCMHLLSFYLCELLCS